MSELRDFRITNTFKIDNIEFVSLRDASMYYGVSEKNVYARLSRGWSLEEALEHKDRTHCKNELHEYALKQGVSIRAVYFRIKRQRKKLQEWFRNADLPKAFIDQLGTDVSFIIDLCTRFDFVNRSDIFRPDGHVYLSGNYVKLNYFFSEMKTGLKVVLKVDKIVIFSGHLSTEYGFTIDHDSLVFLPLVDMTRKENYAIKKVCKGCYRDDIENFLSEFKMYI